MLFPSKSTWSFAIAGILLSAGCGDGIEQNSSGKPANSASAAEKQNSQESTNQNAQESSSQQVDPKRKETKWIGDIPYDVFYDQPLAIAADNSTIQTTPANSNSASSGSEQPMPAETVSSDSASGSTASAGDVNWPDVIPMPVLVEELKQIRARLNGTLQTVATYNRSTEEIALDGAIIAALGSIITVHPEADTWKERGKYVRDLGYAIYSECGESGRTAFKATEEPFLKLQTALDGGTVDDVEAEEVVPFSDVAYLSDMMVRIENGFGDLKANINTASRMTEAPEAVERELRILAALGTMMGTPSYENTEAKQYQAYVKKFVAGAMAGVTAVKSENYDGFRDGLNAIQTTCAECHQQYRGSDTGF